MDSNGPRESEKQPKTKVMTGSIFSSVYVRSIGLLIEISIDNIDTGKFPNKMYEIYENTKDNSIIQLFPYVSSNYDPLEAIKEIKESINNLKTRLSNLKKINKSLNEIDTNSSPMTWDELKSITFNLHNNEELLK